MSITYASGGRYYSIKKLKDKKGKVYGEVSRIKCAEYDNPKTNPTLGKVKPKVGDRVSVIIKPYNEYNCISGIVKDVLTRSEVHSHGHKVRVENKNGIYIGRVVKFI